MTYLCKRCVLVAGGRALDLANALTHIHAMHRIRQRHVLPIDTAHKQPIPVPTQPVLAQPRQCTATERHIPSLLACSQRRHALCQRLKARIELQRHSTTARALYEANQRRSCHTAGLHFHAPLHDEMRLTAHG